LGDYALVQERIGIGDVEMQLAPAAPNMARNLISGLHTKMIILRCVSDTIDTYG
jgi:hypothetical protein